MRGDLILVVDNEFDLRNAVAESLIDSGFRVTICANGLQALQELAKELPGLVLLDMHMPVLDAQGFAERMAAYGAHVPIIVMSDSPVFREELTKLGAIGFISKRFDLDDLTMRISERLMWQRAA